MQTHQLNWKEKYAALLVTIAGCLLLGLLAVDISSSQATSYTMQQDAILINKQELYTKTRALVNILVAIGGGLLLLRGRILGWSCSLAVLSLLLVLSGSVMVQLGYLRLFNTFFIILAGAWILLLLALLVVLSAKLRRKLGIGRTAWILAVVLFLGLGALNFFLQ